MRKYTFDAHGWQTDGEWSYLINLETITDKQWLELKDMTAEDFIKEAAEHAECYEYASIEYANEYGHYETDFDKKIAHMNLDS